MIFIANAAVKVTYRKLEIHFILRTSIADTLVWTFSLAFSYFIKVQIYDSFYRELASSQHQH